jgi:hypothetical protein
MLGEHAPALEQALEVLWRQSRSVPRKAHRVASQLAAQYGGVTIPTSTIFDWFKHRNHLAANAASMRMFSSRQPKRAAFLRQPPQTKKTLTDLKPLDASMQNDVSIDVPVPDRDLV